VTTHQDDQPVREACQGPMHSGRESTSHNSTSGRPPTPSPATGTYIAPPWAGAKAPVAAPDALGIPAPACDERVLVAPPGTAPAVTAPPVTGPSPAEPGDPGEPPVPPQVPPAEGASLLEELRAVIKRYVVLPNPEALDAVTLWTAATHLQSSWQHAPRLAVVGPVKRCGKSRLLEVLYETVHDPCITVNASASAVFRSITDEPPTLMIDEADTMFGTARVAEKNEELRGLLNAGHQRNRPTLRVVGNDHKPHQFPTFAMAVIAGIGELPDTIMDRAVVIRMRRRAPGEYAAPMTRRATPPMNALRERLVAWLDTVAEAAAVAEPAMPVEDRASDTWEPLVIVADLAGDTWPTRARVACATMVAAEAGNDDDAALGIRLLADCRRVFADHNGIPALSTTALLKALNGDCEAPWAEDGTNGLTSRRLGSLLKDFGITSANTRFPEGHQAKGYALNKFLDAWRRYCPDPTPAPAPAPPGRP
jgi:hypothetical protein